MSKHTFAAIKGPNIGDVFEFNINNGESKELPGGGIIYVEKKLFRQPRLMYKHEKYAVHELALNETVSSGQGVVLTLLSSDLYPNDCSKFQKFEGISSLLQGKPDMRYLGWIEPHLNPVQKTIVEQIGGSFEDYVTAYLKNPLEVIAKQNEILGNIKPTLIDIVDGKGNRIGIREPTEKTILNFSQVYDNQHFADAIILNTLIEKALFESHSEKDAAHYDELQNIEFLVENDCLPGKDFELGNEKTYSRFKTTVHKARNENILDFMAESKKIGSQGQGNSKLNSALRVYGLMLEKYSEEGIYSLQPNISLSLGHFFEKGGECLTKAPALQIALQEAGVKSRMVRGTFGFSTQHKHAWVEADIFGDRTYALVLDPNKKNIFIKEEGIFKKAYHYCEEFNTLWRPKAYK